MDTVLWIVQNNLGSSSDFNSLKSECLSNPRTDFFSVRVEPFSLELPVLPRENSAALYGSASSTVIYGSTGFTTLAYNSGCWNPGVFYSPTEFRYSRYLEKYGNKLLNSNPIFLTPREICSFNNKGSVFVRPNNDLKGIAGKVWDWDMLKQWCRRLINNEDIVFDTDQELVLSRPISIDKEWRVFIVDGSIVSGSLYRKNGISASGSIPSSVREFVLSAIDWTPSSVFVLDIALASGSLRIVEANSFNSSGFYSSDIGAIVKAVTDYVLR